MTRFVFLAYLACASLVAGEEISKEGCTPGTQGSSQTQDASVLLQTVARVDSAVREENHDDEGVDSEDSAENHDDEGATRALLNTRDSTQEDLDCPFKWKKFVCDCAKKIDGCKKVANGDCGARDNCKKKVKKCSKGTWHFDMIPGVCKDECKKKINEGCSLLELDSNVDVTEASNRSVEDEEDKDDEEDLDLGLDDEGGQKSLEETISGKRSC